MLPRDEPLAYNGERKRITEYIGNHVPPVLNQWYTLCDLKGGVTIHAARAWQICVPAVNQNVEEEITINGVPFVTVALAHGSGTTRPLSIGASNFAGQLVGNQFDGIAMGFVLYSYWAFIGGNAGWTTAPLECDTLRIRYRMTSIGGAQQLFVRAQIMTVV